MKRAILIGLIGSSVAGCIQITAPQPQNLGLAIYEGRVAVNARLRGHEDILPSMVGVCIHCHESSLQPNQTKGTFGSRLNKAYLTTVSSRRGGAPMAYQEASFCQVLSNGVDPAQVLLHKAMPLFELNHEQCHALWTYLSNRDG
jgi:hypothetical protein